jgi:mono/diheme cytochrome c family protein
MKIALITALGCMLLNAADGKALFEKKCSICHSSSTDERRVGPSLKDEKRRATRELILKKINEGGNGMPVFRELLTNEQKEAIADYVLTF